MVFGCRYNQKCIHVHCMPGEQVWLMSSNWFELNAFFCIDIQTHVLHSFLISFLQIQLQLMYAAIKSKSQNLNHQNGK